MYTIGVIVRDDDAATDTSGSMTVVYDPDAGSANIDGSTATPAGAWASPPSHRARERSRMGCGPTATPRPVRRVGFPTAGARTGSAASAGRYGGDAVVFGKPV